MKKWLSILLPAAMLAMPMAGCAPTLSINGQECRVMSAREETVMREYARTVLLNEKDSLAPAEQTLVRTRPPVERITYRGDLEGKAEYTWNLGEGKEAQVVINGRFLSESISIKTKFFTSGDAAAARPKPVLAPKR